MNKNEKINRRNKRTAIIVLVSLLIWVFALREREKDPVPMKKVGHDGVKIDSPQGGDGRFQIDTDESNWEDNPTVVINSAPERTVEEIPQPQTDEVYEAYEEYIAPEVVEEEEAEEVKEPHIVESSEAGTVVVTEETGGNKESDPTVDTFVGNGEVIGEPDPSTAE